MEEHPVLAPRGFTALTAPIEELGAALTACLRKNATGLLCTGPSRFGKSSAREFITGNLRRSMPVFSQFVQEFDQAGTAPKFWRGFKVDGTHDELQVSSPYDALMARVALECDRLKTPRVMFVLDEAQGLTDQQIRMLKFLTENLIERKFHPFVLMYAQPEIQPWVDRIKLTRPDLFARFFTDQLKFRGLKLGQVERPLSHYDTACWPVGSPVTYTRHFLPELWSRGWRMQAQAKGLWDAFVALAGRLQVGSADLEVACESLTRAALLLMLALQEEPERAGSRELFQEVVEKSGFVELLMVVREARKPTSKKSGRHDERNSLVF